MSDTKLTATLEEYLGAIYRIEMENRVVRPRDICEAQGVAASTVTAALQRLADKELINYKPYEVITLTDQGRARAERIVMGHRIIRDFLENILGLNAERANTTACGMEHAADGKAVERFICFLAFMRRRSSAGSRCLRDFKEFLAQGSDATSCSECVQAYMEDLKTSEL